MNRADSVPPRPGPRSLELRHTSVGPEGGPAVVLLHGITASRRYWLPRVLPLAERHRLLIPDLPGFGRSPKPFADYTMDFFCEALLGFLERHADGSEPLCFVGHSLGALIGLELAARHPRRVARLAALGMPRFEGPETAHRIMLDGSPSYRRLLTVNSLASTLSQMRRTGWRLTARYVRRLPWTVLADARRFTFRSLTSTLENCLLHYSADASFAHYPRDKPLLLIHGEQDQVAPLEPLRRLLDGEPRYTLHVIRGAGHHVLHTHTTECLRLLRAFLVD